jgi:hypothetical protein
MFDLRTLERLNAEQEKREREHEVRAEIRRMTRGRLPHEEALDNAPICCLGLPQAPEPLVQ